MNPNSKSLMQAKRMHSLIHCKHCKGMLMKNISTNDMEGNISFLIRCPHCKNDCAVKIAISKLPVINTQ